MICTLTFSCSGRIPSRLSARRIFGNWVNWMCMSQHLAVPPFSSLSNYVFRTHNTRTVLRQTNETIHMVSPIRERKWNWASSALVTVVCNLQQHAYVYLCIHEAFVSAPAYGSHVCVFVFKTLISICRNDTLRPCFQGPLVSCIHYTHYTQSLHLSSLTLHIPLRQRKAVAGFHQGPNSNLQTSTKTTSYLI